MRDLSESTRRTASRSNRSRPTVSAMTPNYGTAGGNSTARLTGREQCAVKGLVVSSWSAETVTSWAPIAFPERIEGAPFTMSATTDWQGRS
jgi:hypothetical protein